MWLRSIILGACLASLIGCSDPQQEFLSQCQQSNDYDAGTCSCIYQQLSVDISEQQISELLEKNIKLNQQMQEKVQQIKLQCEFQTMLSRHKKALAESIDS